MRPARVFTARIIGIALLVGACSQEPASNEPGPSVSAAVARPTIVFMTDFGTANDAVAICRAVIYGIAPNVRITDITHQVTPYSIEEASRFLFAVTPYYPKGTIFLIVVDPGVGSSRKAIVAKSRKGHYFVLPDNGLVTAVLDRDGLDSAREITSQMWMIQTPVSSTFHGRDIFSPTAAHLAAGWDFTQVGPIVPELVRLVPKVPVITDKGIRGRIVALDDPYGSLVTDITGEQLRQLGYGLGDQVSVELNQKRVRLPYVKTFAAAAVGEPLLYVDSRGRVGIAINQGNYSRKFHITPPGTIFVPRKPGQVGNK